MTIEISILDNAIETMQGIPLLLRQIQGKRVGVLTYKLTAKAIYSEVGISKVTYYKYLKEPETMPLELAKSLLILIDKYQSLIKKK